ncbi:hypothetical protein, partial [Mycobacterium tuberculosis]|uniref:hypothetical protein n=1 Tax=Mycobacterium tuberculosis TaxID=1773 RepID=UPI00131F0FEB
MAQPTSHQHLIFRLMRSLRDILAGFKAKDIRSAQFRVVYSGECTFTEPVHIEKVFATPTIITAKIQKTIVQEIMIEHTNKAHEGYSICGYVLNGISSRGFQYDGDERVV